MGSIVVAAATSQFSSSAGSASLSASLRQGAAETSLGFVYDAVQPTGSCPDYRGYQEGTTLSIALFDYGAKGFTPAGFVVNSTAYAGSYAETEGGALRVYSLTLAGCAHQSGLTIMAYDGAGDEAEFET